MLCTALAAWATPPGEPGAGAPVRFRIGVLPTNSTQVVLRMYQPMRTFLEQELGRDVQLETATDYRAFYHDAKRGTFDLVITAPHLARLHALEHDMHPLVMNLPSARVLVVVASGSALRRVRHLRGKTIAIHDELSIAALMGEEWLRGGGLLEGRDFRLLRQPTQTSSVLALGQGEAHAALVTDAALAQLPDSARGSVRILAVAGNVPGMVYLAPARMPAVERDALSAALLRFSADTSRWMPFGSAAGYRAIVPYNERELKRVDRYLPALRKALDRSRSSRVRSTGEASE